MVVIENYYDNLITIGKVKFHILIVPCFSWHCLILKFVFVQEYINLLEEAKKYDHRLLGTKQELFFCHPLR